MAQIVSFEKKPKLVHSGRIAVEAHNIAAELERIRQEAVRIDLEQDTANGGAAAARFKVTLFNLIIFVSRHAQAVAADVIDELIGKLCISCPSRFFVIEYGCDGAQAECVCDSKVVTSVSSRCVLANSGLHVCSEEVYLSVRPKSLPVVSNLLLSLMVPNASSVLLMLCDPARKLLNCWHAHAEDRFVRLVQSMAKQCELMLYDSALFENYHESLDSLLRQQESSLLPRGDLPHQDLNWQRTSRWRSLIAEQFDSHCFSDALGAIEQVRVISRTNEASSSSLLVPSPALIMAGWFVACLKWRVTDQSSRGEGSLITVGCKAQSGKVNFVQFAQCPAKSQQGFFSEVASIEICFSSFSTLKMLKLECCAEEDCISVSTELWPAENSCNSSSEKYSRKVPLMSRSLDQLVVEDMMQASVTDDAYLSSIKAARELSQLVRPG